MGVGETRSKRALPPTLLFAAIAIVFGTLDAGLVIGWRQIDPGQLAWLRKDPAVYQAGWEFMRHAALNFPPTWLAHLDFPFGISAAYLDVIPLVAVPLKLVSPLLPRFFQYLGLYAALCLVLQTWFALRLMSRFTDDKILIFLGALFFLNSPILLMRLYGHFSLCSQWLLLAALYYYFRPIGSIRTTRYLWPFAPLLAVSAGTSPYLSLMVLGISGAALARSRYGEGHRSIEDGSSDSEIRSRHGLLVGRVADYGLYLPLAWAAIFLFCLAVSLIFFGFVAPGSMPAISGGGYGAYSMNLLAPINPSGSSILFRSFAVLPLQVFEGYNYLGAGVIGLGALCLARDPHLLVNLWHPTLRPLIFMSLIFFIAALSARIAIGPSVVLIIPLPRFALDLLSVFRSSGRFFWPVHDLLTLGALVGTLSTLRRPPAARVALAAALLLQFFDLLPVRQSVAQESARVATSPLVAKDWRTLAKGNKHLILLPARQCDALGTPGGDPAWPWFAGLAARSGMTLNSVHAARSSAASESYNCVTLPLEVAQSKLLRDAAYVLGDHLALLAIAHDHTHFCRRVDGFNLCTFDPANAHKSNALAQWLAERAGQNGLGAPPAP